MLMTPLRPKPFKSFVLGAFLDYHTSFEPPNEGEQSYACVKNKSVSSLRKVDFSEIGGYMLKNCTHISRF